MSKWKDPVVIGVTVGTPIEGPRVVRRDITATVVSSTGALPSRVSGFVTEAKDGGRRIYLTHADGKQLTSKSLVYSTVGGGAQTEVGTRLWEAIVSKVTPATKTLPKEPASKKDPKHFAKLRREMREFAQTSVSLPSTGKLLVSFRGMEWLGVLELVQTGGGTVGTWRNVRSVSPY